MNRKLKKILVATDFSETSEYALSRAVELAKTNNAELTLLHVIEKKNIDELLDNFLGKILPDSLWLSTEEYYLNLLQEKINALASHKLKINKAIFSSGNPAIKTLGFAKKYKFDLLAIGAHGKYSIRDIFVGTTAEYIAKKTICPVLIIKNQPHTSFRKMMVPINFSKTSKNAFDFALHLFPHAVINLLHVGNYEYEDLLKKEEENISKSTLTKLKKAIFLYLDNMMKKFIKSAGKKHRKISYSIQLGYPAPIIINEAEKKNQDLIVMGTQGHGKLHYLLIGRVAYAVLKETNKDILLVPPNR